MGQEINLLKRLPPPAKRGPRHDAATGPNPADQQIARRYGADYFDGDRKYGYGGYRYDGRWKPVAADIMTHFHLEPGARILDIGCAKGFLVADLVQYQKADAFGLDISSYAIAHGDPTVTGRLHHGNAWKLPFPDRSFHAVVSINTLHNLELDGLMAALREIRRVCIKPGAAFVQVDAYRNAREYERFQSWVLTARTHGSPDYWKRIFTEAGYIGDYFWTIN